VPSLLHDAAAFHDNDAVEIGYRLKPMRHRDQRTALGHLLERLREGRLRRKIKRGGRLIEEQDCRIAYDRPRNREPLPLTSRKGCCPARRWRCHSRSGGSR
jgi:hypothetical protein